MTPLIERLRRQAHNESEASRMMAEAKSLRQESNHERRTDLYAFTPPEQTLSWQAADEIERLGEQLNKACDAADYVLAPICASVGRYLYDTADCPNMIAMAHSHDVKVSAMDFRRLYDETHPDIRPPRKAAS